MCEILAAVAATWHCRTMLQGRDVLLFVDNEAAAVALVKGSAGCPDAAAAVAVAHAMWAGMGARVWIEWVDSESNPADGPSRDGVGCMYCAAHGWSVEAPQQPPWEEFFSGPDRLHRLITACVGVQQRTPHANVPR